MPDAPDPEDTQGPDPKREDSVPDVAPFTGGAICGAKRRDGGICTQPAMGNGKCKMHGGTSKTGVAHHSFKHGRYADSDKLAVTLERMGVDLDERAADPRLMDVRRPAAIQEHIVNYMAKMAADNESPEWRSMVFGEFRDAMSTLADNTVKGEKALNRVLNMIERGTKEAECSRNLQAANLELAKTQGAYWKAALAAKEAVSREEFAGALFALVDIIEDEIDKNAAQRILERADADIFGGLLGFDRKEAPREAMPRG